MKRLILSLFVFSTIIYPSDEFGNSKPDLYQNDHGQYFDDLIKIDNQVSSNFYNNQFNISINRNTRTGSFLEHIGSWGEIQDGSYWIITSINDTVFFNAGSELIIADFTDPSNPVVLGQTSLPGIPHWGTIELRDDYLYVANGSSGFAIYDVSDLSNPYQLGLFQYNNGRAYQFVLVGDTAYVASRQAGLIILDISDPSNPSEIASYESTNHIDAVAEMVKSLFLM